VRGEGACLLVLLAPMLKSVHPPRASPVTSRVPTLHFTDAANTCQQPAIEPAALLLAQCCSAASQHISQLVQLMAAWQLAQH
jgi:hypothetical protein